MADNRAFGSRIRPFPSVLRTRFATRATRIATTSEINLGNFAIFRSEFPALERSSRRETTRGSPLAVSRCLFLSVTDSHDRSDRFIESIVSSSVRAESRELSAIDRRICGIYGRN